MQLTWIRFSEGSQEVHAPGTGQESGKQSSSGGAKSRLMLFGAVLKERSLEQVTLVNGTVRFYFLQNTSCCQHAF